MVLALSLLLVVTSVLMIILVLLHKGKGSGLSDLLTAEVQLLSATSIVLPS